MRHALTALAVVLAAPAVATPAAAAPGPVYAAGACALDLDHDRPVIPLVVATPTGGTRVLRCLVDTGGSAFLLSAEAGAALGRAPGTMWRRAAPPAAWVARTALAWRDTPAFVAPPDTRLVPGGHIDAVLPGAVVNHYRVVFDYPARRFMLADATRPAPWSRPSGGVTLALAAADAVGHPTLAVTVAGAPARFALDTAAAVTTVANAPAGLARCTPWVGAADLDGESGPSYALVRLPRLGWGPLTFQHVLAAVGQAPHGGAAKVETDATLAGALGGNVLRTLRLELDPVAHAATVHVRSAVNPTDLDTAGLALAPRAGGGFAVAGVASGCPGPVREAVRPGDELLAIDDLDLVATVTHAVATNALRGRVGEKRALVLRRAGRQFTVDAPIVRLL